MTPTRSRAAGPELRTPAACAHSTHLARQSQLELLQALHLGLLLLAEVVRDLFLPCAERELLLKRSVGLLDAPELLHDALHLRVLLEQGSLVLLRQVAQNRLEHRAHGLEGIVRWASILLLLPVPHRLGRRRPLFFAPHRVAQHGGALLHEFCDAWVAVQTVLHVRPAVGVDILQYVPRCFVRARHFDCKYFLEVRRDRRCYAANAGALTALWRPQRGFNRTWNVTLTCSAVVSSSHCKQKSA
jgi:hypothetical protein